MGAANYTDEAVKVFTSLIRKNKREHIADLLLADMYKTNNDLEKAEEVLATVYNRVPPNIETVKAYAGILLAKRKLKEAKQVLAKYNPKKGEEVDYLAIYAASNFELEYYSQAKEQCFLN